MAADDAELAKGVVDRATVIREMIRHEDALRAQRLGWLFTLDGFLFAALGFSWDAKGSSWLIFVLGLLGVVIGLSAVASMAISDKAIRTLKSLAPKEPHQDHDALVRVAGLDSAEIPGPINLFVPWQVMPWALVGIWPVLWVVSLIVHHNS